MPATQNDMTTSSDTSRKTCFGSVSHRHGNFTLTTVARGRLQTVAMGCGHQKQGHANTSSPPDPQNVKRKPFALHSRKIWIQMVLPQFLPNVQKQKIRIYETKKYDRKNPAIISTHFAKDFTFSSASRRCVAVQASPGRVGDFSHLDVTSLYKGCWLPGYCPKKDTWTLHPI